MKKAMNVRPVATGWRTRALVRCFNEEDEYDAPVTADTTAAIS